MNEVLSYCIIAIPIIIGVVEGIKKKIASDNRYVNEAITVVVSVVSVLYYSMYLNSLEVSYMAVMLVINYFGASGIYQFIPNDKGLAYGIDDDLESEE